MLLRLSDVSRTRIERYNDAGQLQGLSEFGYDYASRRVHTRESSYVNGALTGVENTFRVFDGLDVVQERHENNFLKAQLVRDGNIAGILSRTTADGPAFYGYDDRGNVALLTNSAGQDVGHYRYDAFGNTLEADGARAGENPYRFSTKELHGPSGIYDFGFRFYSPGMGRWLNRDPIREMGGINLYAMVRNNPVNSVDEYGLIPTQPQIPVKYWKYQGTNFSRKEMDVLNKLHQQMQSGGVGFLVPYLKYGGKANLGYSGGNKVTAETRPGLFWRIGTITTLDNGFFKGNSGLSQLGTLIHEALHVYAGVSATGGSPDNPPHARLYEWAEKITDVIEAGGTMRIPTNLDEVIRKDAIPKYKERN